MIILRQGRRQGRNLYLQSGPTPSDADTLCGQVDTPELARLIVAAVESVEVSMAFGQTYSADDLERVKSAARAYNIAREQVSS